MVIQYLLSMFRKFSEYRFVYFVLDEFFEESEIVFAFEFFVLTVRLQFSFEGFRSGFRKRFQRQSSFGNGFHQRNVGLERFLDVVADYVLPDTCVIILRQLVEHDGLVQPVQDFFFQELLRFPNHFFLVHPDFFKFVIRRFEPDPLFRRT